MGPKIKETFLPFGKEWGINGKRIMEGGGNPLRKRKIPGPIPKFLWE